MLKFYYYGREYCTGESLAKVLGLIRTGGELWAWELKNGAPVNTPSVLSADAITDVRPM